MLCSWSASSNSLKKSVTFMLSTCSKWFVTPVYQQQREYAARKGKRAALLAAKRARKLAEASKPKVTSKYVPKKLIYSTAKELKRCTDDNWFSSIPIDDVYRTALHRGKPYAFPEVISMLQETHHPSILNDSTAFVYANLELDLQTKKKNSYLDTFNGIITYNHEFETGTSNRVIAVCKNQNDQQKATEAGAVYAGAATLIKQILSGEISSEDYDYVVCHPDMYKELTVLRGILKRNYPTAYNGLLRIDVDKGVQTFIKGIKYSSESSSVELDFGWLDTCFGRLHMPLSNIEENFKHLLNVVEKHKPQGTQDRNFITRVSIWCEKSPEKYKIPHWEYMPSYQVLDDTSPEDFETKTE